MPRHSAIRFEHHASFVDYVRQHAGEEAQESYTIHACVRAGEDGPRNVYFLTSSGGVAWARRVARRGWWKVLIDLDASKGEITQIDKDQVWRYPLTASRQERHLALLVGPKDILGQEGSPDLTVLWSDSQETFQRLIGMSLSLGCDRLQYATMDGDRKHPGYLLRAERVSNYVIDSAIEIPDTKVYVPQANGDLYVQWGTAHPLEDLLTGVGEGGSVVFMDGLGVEARTRRVSLPPWKDVYQLTNFALSDLKTDETWKESGTSPEEFVVKLRLTPTHVSREPHVWLVHEREQPRVERLLRAIPEPDLDNLQFTAQETPEGERYLLIRERHTGIGREYIDFEGVQLGPWAGYPNLMLPVDRELEPQLRKDRYRSLFELRSGYTTLLWQDSDQLRLVHVQERSFRPLREFVDYIIGVEGAALEQIIAQTAFDFQNYRYAKAAHTPRAARKTREKEPTETPDWEVEPEDDAVPTVAATRVKKARPEAKVKRPVKPKKKTPSELEANEAALESDLILKGQTIESWENLAQVKTDLGKDREAALCLSEAMWLTTDPTTTQALELQIADALQRPGCFALEGMDNRSRDKTLREHIARKDSDAGWVWLWLTLGARHFETRPNDPNTHSWLSEGHRLLSERSEGLRKKDRWILWNRLISINHDAVEQTRVREELLEELNKRGLRPQDVPQFIQNRIYQSRLIDDGGLAGGAEARAAMRILERIETELTNARDESVRIISDAILAYGFERLGDRARAAQHFQEAERSFQSSSGLTGIERAWIALYLGASQEVVQEHSGQDWLERYERLFKQHKGGDLFSSELETIQRHLLERATSDSPTKFLDAENFRSLYPSAQKYTQGQAIRHEIEGMIQRGEFERALDYLQNLAGRAASRDLNLDTRELAWLLQHVVVKTMRRIGRAAEGGGILHKFEQGRIDPQEDTMGGFYPTLYMITLGEGFLDLGEERRGMDLVCGAVRSAWAGSQRLQWLDHLDMLSAALNGIEIAPLEHRIDAVNEVLQALFLDRKHPTGSDRPQYRPIKLRLLDHCVEVGLSKEKLSLKRYKNYLEEDEFHVRQRIITERLT